MAAGIARFHTPAMLDLARRYGLTENLVGRYHEHDHQLVYALDKLEVSEKLVHIDDAQRVISKNNYLFERN